MLLLMLLLLLLLGKDPGGQGCRVLLTARAAASPAMPLSEPEARAEVSQDRLELLAVDEEDADEGQRADERAEQRGVDVWADEIAGRRGGAAQSSLVGSAVAAGCRRLRS